MSTSQQNDDPSLIATSAYRWSESIVTARERDPLEAYTIGVLPGEGVGPELIEAALKVLYAAGEARSLEFNILRGGAIGLPAMAAAGKPLSDDVIEFCQQIFSAQGAILTGAGGSRFVYDIRRCFDLFCKLNPLVPNPSVSNCGVVKPDVLTDVDIMVVRDNSGGVYQGEWSETIAADVGRKAMHTFSYDEAQVRRVLQVGAAIARRRSGRMAVIVKNDGVPGISELWNDCATPIVDQYGVTLETLDIDYAVYRLVQSPTSFDVMVTPNLFGDIVADVGGALLGSRGLCHGASYSAGGAAVFQTNHGAAYDLAGKDTANPAAQMLAMSSMLHESFGLTQEALLIESAISQVWRRGYRTFDVMESGCKLVGTQKMAELTVEAIHQPEYD